MSSKYASYFKFNIKKQYIIILMFAKQKYLKFFLFKPCFFYLPNKETRSYQAIAPRDGLGMNSGQNFKRQGQV
jgi:hypothetical protein